MTLRIAVLAHNLRAGGGISIGRNLIAALGRIAPEHSYFVTVPTGLGYESVCQDMAQVKVVPFNANGNPFRLAIFNLVELRRLLLAFAPDVILGLGGIAVDGINIPQAILCHNPNRFYKPIEWASSDVHVSFRYQILNILRNMRFSHDLKRVSLVFSPTATAEHRIRDMYGYTGRIARSPNAISDLVLKAQVGPMPEPLKPYSSKRKLFCLTRYYPHKNLEIFIDLYEKYAHELSETIIITTITADQHPKARWFLDKVNRIGLADRIINVGPLSQSDLPSYYNACDALILPTLLECFTGTYYEAMYFRTPILTSSLDFAHEICGDAALYFEPRNPSSIMQAIQSLASSQLELTTRGTNKFKNNNKSWDEIAGDLLMELVSIAHD